MLGYPSILSKSNNKTIMERFDITTLVNGTYELLRKQQINNKLKEDLEERYEIEKCVFVHVLSGPNPEVTWTFRFFVLVIFLAL